MLFRDIPGNNSIKKELTQSVKNNRITHAQIFSGNKGSPVKLRVITSSLS